MFLTSILNRCLCFTTHCALWVASLRLKTWCPRIDSPLDWFTFGLFDSGLSVNFYYYGGSNSKLVQNSTLVLKLLWEEPDLEGLCVTRNEAIINWNIKSREKRICEKLKIKIECLPISLINILYLNCEKCGPPSLFLSLSPEPKWCSMLQGSLPSILKHEFTIVHMHLQGPRTVLGLEG